MSFLIIDPQEDQFTIDQQWFTLLIFNPLLQVWDYLVKCIGLIISIVVAATYNILQIMYLKDQQPYHTSALSGQD
jgi:hypothetical protein